jgi:serine/threonine protein kinase
VAYVSRRHARLTVNYHDVFVEDLGSSNGSFLNDTKVEGCVRVWPGQKIRLGAAMIEIRRKKGSRDPNSSRPPETDHVHKLLPEESRSERKYEIGNVIAEGGMGVVMEATEIPLNRKVAMKVMTQTTPELVARFIEEAQIAGQLEHPSIVPIYELSVNEYDHPFYTMKLVRGSNLRQLLDDLARGAEGTAPPQRLGSLIEIFLKICDGIAYAHAKGVIHRDLKPENIMLGEFNEVLIMDWGLAKTLGKPAHTGAGGGRSMVRSVRQDSAGEALTMDGAILGTPHFMSPEQARGEVRNLDARTDIYGLGAILYQILTLENPVRGSDSDEVLDNVRAGNVPNPRERVRGKELPHLPPGGVPEPLATVCMKALSPDPILRYSRVDELQADIARCNAGQTAQFWSAIGGWISGRKGK